MVNRCQGGDKALVVVDMPFGTYQGNSLEALNSAIKIMKITHADAVKLEEGKRKSNQLNGLSWLGYL